MTEQNKTFHSELLRPARGRREGEEEEGEKKKEKQPHPVGPVSGSDTGSASLRFVFII